MEYLYWVRKRTRPGDWQPQLRDEEWIGSDEMGLGRQKNPYRGPDEGWVRRENEEKVAPYGARKEGGIKGKSDCSIRLGRTRGHFEDPKTRCSSYKSIENFIAEITSSLITFTTV